MPDLFLGAAAGPPGLPDWIDHAFPVPVKNGPAYLATAVAALSISGSGSGSGSVSVSVSVWSGQMEDLPSLLSSSGAGKDNA